VDAAGIDLSDTAFWGLPAGERSAFFAEPETPFTEKGPGYYALVQYADVAEASRHADVFCSGQGTTSIPGSQYGPGGPGAGPSGDDVLSSLVTANIDPGTRDHRG
jgi:hypothetical protein